MATRKDRNAMGWAGAGRKQRRKHQAKHTARAMARRQVELEHITAELQTHTQGCAATVTGVRFCGGSHPYQALGTAVLADGTPQEWYFRFRFDRAFLEVGVSDDDYGLVDRCVLAAWHDDVTGNPYEGWLPTSDAIELMAQLFTQLAPPQAGTRFAERLSNTIDLALGRDSGDVDQPHLMRTIHQP